jgi:type II secretory pathway component PulK
MSPQDKQQLLWQFELWQKLSRAKAPLYRALSQPERPLGPMPTRPSSPVLWRRDRGFALIIVLWTMVLIAFIVAQLTVTGRTEIQIASNLIANAVAQAAADGVCAAIFNQSDPQPEQRWPVNGNAREVVVGNSRVNLRLEDEAWWINPSSASPALLEALLRVTGSDPESARRLAIAVREWVGSTPGARPQNAVLADYRAAGSITGRLARPSRPSTSSAGCSA